MRPTVICSTWSNRTDLEWTTFGRLRQGHWSRALQSKFGRGVEEMNAHQRRVARRAKAGKKQQWLKKKIGFLTKIKKVFGQ